MDIKTILGHLNHESANIQQEIITINDKITRLNEDLRVRENKKDNMYITISMLEKLYPIIETNTLVKKRSKKVQKEPIVKVQEDTIKRSVSLKEIMIPILSKTPMTPKEIFNSIEDKAISKNLLNAIYASLGNNKEIFKKDLVTKKWALK